MIVPGSDLSINECAVPRSMAVELFEPFIHSKLMLESKINGQRNIKNLLCCDQQNGI